MAGDIDLRTLREWGRRYSNWQRFGPDDDLGTLRYLTPDRVIAASRLPQRGTVVSCAWPVGAGEAGGVPPHGAIHDDAAPPRSGGAGGARWEPPGQVSYDGRAWNDRPVTELPARGARNATLDRFGDGVVGRGVLLDLPGRFGIPWLDEGTRIAPADLDACAEASGVTVETGDILLVRTGRLTRAIVDGSWPSYAGGPTPGLSLRCARWLHERQVAAVATDTWCVEVQPSEVPDVALPFHQLAVRDMGLLLGESFHLDRLAEACAADGHYAFLFAAATLPGAGHSAGAINPLAIK